VKLKYLDAVEKSAGKDAENYAWLYYQDYAGELYDSGDTEGARKYLDALTNKDKTKFGAYELKLRIALSQGDKDEANRVLAEFKVNNDGYDTAYVLEATLLRVQGEYDKAKVLLEEAFEQYDSVPELHRQLALIYLMEGDYDKAFEEAYAADSNAYMLYAYMGDSSAYTPQLNNTLYLCSVLCRDKGTGTSENAIYIEEILTYYSEDELSEQVLSIINGEKTVEQVLTEGVCDLA
jgi:tetratricopeptide (TPR) repeat protein